jgi:hypothetical protein
MKIKIIKYRQNMKRIMTLGFIIFSFSSLLGEVTTWDPPEIVSSANVNASDPRIDIDLNGNLVAIWVENGSVVANAKPYGGSWGTLATLSSGVASNPRVMVDQNGNAIAVWIDDGVVKTASLALNGSWSSPTTLSVSGASDPRLGMDDAGNAVATWTIAGTIQSATKLVSGSWPSLPETISDPGIVSNQSRVAIGSDGTVAVVWHGIQNSIDKIYCVTKPLSGSWDVVQVISRSNVKSTNPRVAVNPEGSTIATWFEFALIGNDYSNVSLASSFSASGGNWEAPVTVTRGYGITNPNNLSSNLRMDGDGTAVAAWNISYDGSYYSIESAVRMTNGSWTLAEAIDVNVYANTVSLDANPNGGTAIAFTRQQMSHIQIESANMNMDSYAPNAWANLATISTGDINSFPNISTTVFNSVNHVAVIWQGYDGVNSNVQVTTGFGEDFIPPSNFSAVQNETDFGIFKQYSNTLTWSPSTDVELQGYVIFRNGTLIATLTSDFLEFVDYNRDPDVSDEYAIAAFGSGSAQSESVYLTFP